MSDAKKASELADMICAFVRSVAVGHERGIFRALTRHQQPLDIVKNRNGFAMLFTGPSLSYFNNAYRSLILKNDKYIENCFGCMHSVSGHTYICLLNVVFVGYMTVHQAVDRSKLDTRSLEAYQASFEALFDVILADFRQSLSEKLDHKCSGLDISKCDPNITMFHASTTVVLQEKEEKKKKEKEEEEKKKKEKKEKEEENKKEKKEKEEPAAPHPSSLPPFSSSSAATNSPNLSSAPPLASDDKPGRIIF